MQWITHLMQKKQSLRNIIETEEVFVNREGTKYDRLKFDDKNKKVTLRNKESQKRRKYFLRRL